MVEVPIVRAVAKGAGTNNEIWIISLRVAFGEEVIP